VPDVTICVKFFLCTTESYVLISLRVYNNCYIQCAWINWYCDAYM